MAIEARIVLDSFNPMTGKRITTFVARYPRFAHADFMTHRAFSRNASSSRAMPASKLIEQAENDSAWPIFWGQNQKGMQAQLELPYEKKMRAMMEWDKARLAAIECAKRLVEIGLHKQTVNRLLEPFTHITVIITATEWGNFFFLRDSELAQPELHDLAHKIAELYQRSKPRHLQSGEWHLPFILPEEFEKFDRETLLKCSVARCARVSYLNHDGSEPNVQKDIELHDMLLSNGHFSPFEHQATPLSFMEWSGNFQGWKQYRKTLPSENHWQLPWEDYCSGLEGYPEATNANR